MLSIGWINYRHNSVNGFSKNDFKCNLKQQFWNWLQSWTGCKVRPFLPNFTRLGPYFGFNGNRRWEWRRTAAREWEGNSTITTTGHHATNFGQSPLIQHPNGLNTQFSKRADICNDWESHKDIIPPHIQNPMN